MRMDIPLKIGFSLMMLSCVIFLFGLGYYIFPWEPLIIHEVKITTPVVKAGDRLRYQVTYSKNEDVVCVVKRGLSNSFLISYDTKEPPRKLLGENLIQPNIAHIPRYADPGDKWYLDITWECEKDFRKQFVITKRTGPFTVVD